MRRLGRPRWSRAQWLLRAVIVLGLLTGLLSALAAGPAPDPVLTAVVVALALVFAAMPDSAAGVLAMLVVAGWWATGPEDPLHPAVLVGAAGLVAAHLAAMLAASGPGTLTPERPLVLLWLRRGVWVWLPLPLLYAVARGLRSAPEPPLVWLAAVSTLVLLFVAGSAVGPAPEPDPADGSPQG